MQPSKYQEKILDWLKNGKGNGCCNAVAGSGKSTTLKMGAKALQEAGISPSEVKVIVFGKANSLDLIAKFGSEWKSSISTCHSAGWSMVKRYLDIRKSDKLINSNKYKKIAQDFDLVARRGLPKGELRRRGALDKDADFIKLIDLVRLTNQEPSRRVIEDICDHFELPDIWQHGTVAEAIADVLDEGEREARQKMGFDFTDMIWLPVRWNIGQERFFKPYKFVLIDECQDLNATQLELSLALAGKDGRLLYVGDPNQAIMGFAGADCDSYSNILRRVRGTELPLSICYRCPSSHIELVKKNFPNIPIEASDRAPVGRILEITEKQLFDSDSPGALKDDDLVLCRKTAPLVSLCIKLISRGIAATVKGRSIGDGLKRDLEEIDKMGFPFAQFGEAIAAWHKVKAEQYKFRDNREQLEEQLQDKCDAIQAIYESQPQAKSIKDLGDYIDDLFSDDHSPITLSTVHRAKGLESDRVFILKPGDMPMTWRNQQEWQKDQEGNILYVALTRSKRDLFIVGKADWLKLEEEEEKPESGSVSIAELQAAWEEKRGIKREEPKTTVSMSFEEFCDRCNQSIRAHQVTQEMIEAALLLDPKEAKRLTELPSIAWEDELSYALLCDRYSHCSWFKSDRFLNAIFKVSASLLDNLEGFAVGENETPETSWKPIKWGRSHNGRILSKCGEWVIEKGQKETLSGKWVPCYSIERNGEIVGDCDRQSEAKDLAERILNGEVESSQDNILPTTPESDTIDAIAEELPLQDGVNEEFLTWEEQFKDLPEQLANYTEPDEIDPLTKAKDAIAQLDFKTKCELFAVWQEEMQQEKEERVKAALIGEMSCLTNAAIAKQLGFVSDVTVGKIRKKMIAEGIIEKPAEVTDSRGKKWRSLFS